MGAAARKIARETQPARPALRVVRGGRKRSAARSRAAASSLFRVMAVGISILAVAGLARVTFAAQAAEASIDAWELRAQVKAERLAERALEADRSALAAPSRIEAVASQTLNMSRPTQVAYLQLPDGGSGEVVPGAEESAPADAGATGPDLVETLMELAADEAEVMLVGDVGLGSFR